MEHTTGNSIQIGPRTRREIELRIRELQCRHNPSPRDRQEVSRLQEFLRAVAPRDGRTLAATAPRQNFGLWRHGGMHRRGRRDELGDVHRVCFGRRDHHGRRGGCRAGNA
jgi:hypothetical protein